MPASGVEWYIARRYLSARKKGRFLSLITWIALGGVTVGVMALVVVLAVMNGAQEDLREMILGSTPHVLVQEHGSALRMDDWRSVLAEVERHDGVRSASPFVLTLVAVQRPDYAQPADLFGVSTAGLDTLDLTDLEAQLFGEGGLSTRTKSGLPPVALGYRLANRMAVFPGDTVQLLSFENMPTDPAFGMPVPAIRPYEVVGMVRTGVYDYDLRNAYAPLAATQELLGILANDQASGIWVRTEDPWMATEVADSIRAGLGGYPYYVESWITTNESLFGALKLEKLAMFVILSLIVMVAAFNIVSTLVMVVSDRTREIGILKSMGMTDQKILRIFMMQGIWIGVIGTLVGAGAGLAIALVLDKTNLITLPVEVYSLDRLPVSIQLWDLVWVISVSVLISLLATIYPSRRASRLEPVEAIRHE